MKSNFKRSSLKFVHGGYVLIEQFLLSHFFDSEIKIADLVSRKKSEARLKKPVGDRQYKDEGAVLIDNNPASASEITARVLQLENRAKTYGDVSSGSVMTSTVFPLRSIMSALAEAAIIQVGMSVTLSDVIMRDRSRLEYNGVVPGEPMQPSRVALAKKTDPVLAIVAQKFGAEITPEQAGSYYFLSKKSEDDDDGEQ
jgi:C-terminal processing protease CtpA/Prc